MMNTHIGLPAHMYDQLSQDARYLYTCIYDYCTYADDPQYKRLHAFRNAINKLVGTDKDIMIQYFNHDPAIRWSGMPCDPWTYYAAPY